MRGERWSFLNLGPAFQAQGCETGLPLAGKRGNQRAEFSEETKRPKSALYSACTGSGDSKSPRSNEAPKAMNPGDGVTPRRVFRQ